MKRFDLVFLPEAKDDLDRLYSWIADRSGERIAERFTGRLRSFCYNLTHAPERGQRRDDLAQGMRLIGYRRRATIIFSIQSNAVLIVRVFYRGKSIEALFAKSDDRS